MTSTLFVATAALLPWIGIGTSVLLGRAPSHVEVTSVFGLCLIVYLIRSLIHARQTQLRSWEIFVFSSWPFPLLYLVPFPVCASWLSGNKAGGWALIACTLAMVMMMSWKMSFTKLVLRLLPPEPDEQA